jgi:DNA repair protein RecO (recombination protein O)
LVTLDSCEIVYSPFDLQADYSVAVVLDYMAEVAEHLLAPAEASERFFRLLVAMLDHLHDRRAEAVWPVATYFTLWAVRLSGFLPELRAGREAKAIAEEMTMKPVAELTPRAWTKETAADLRRFLTLRIEEHVERRLVTAPLLEAL